MATNRRNLCCKKHEQLDTDQVSIIFMCNMPLVKVKVKLTLEQDAKAPTLFLTSALDGGEWSTPRPGRFTPGKDPVPIV